MEELLTRWVNPVRCPVEIHAAMRPRWRLLDCVENQQRSVSRDAHRRFAHSADKHSFFANAFSSFLSRLFVVSFSSPIGIELSASKLTAGNPTQAFMNSQDIANASRGISPTTIYRLKSAALKAIQHSFIVNPRSLKVTSLPHTNGEMLITHHSGWTGRGIVWHEGSAELAMVWQVNSNSSTLPIKISI